MFFVVFRVVKFAIFCFTKLRVFVYKRAGVYVKSNTYFHFTKEFVFPLFISAGQILIFLFTSVQGLQGCLFYKRECFFVCVPRWICYIIFRCKLCAFS